jgi:hypothetical protein
MVRMTLRLGASLAGLLLLAAACSKSSPSTTAPATKPSEGGSMMSPSGGASMMALPAWADAMKATISSPADGTKVTANAVTLRVATSGYQDTCGLAGKPVTKGTGHYHVLIDGSLVNMFCTPTATVSMQNVTLGMHKLSVVPALDDHAEVTMNESSISIDYEPTNPLPAISNATIAGPPSIQILSPKNGATLSGPFDVVVRITNFNATCALMGKPDVSGYGHWHVNLDSMTGPMMGMGTMLGMSCTNVFHATTQGLKAGETHTIIALLTDDGHAPLMPEVTSEVTVHIG